MEKVVKSKTLDLEIKTIVALNSGSATTLETLKELTQMIAGFLKTTKMMNYTESKLTEL